MHHHDPEAFVAQSAKFGAIGKALVTLSSLEWQHDQLMLSVRRHRSSVALSISPRFPRHFRAKTDFLIELLWMCPDLRRVPIIDDGSLNTLWLQYQLDELYDFRARLAHGSIYLEEKLPSGTCWHFDQVVNTGRHEWSIATTSVGDGFLADIAATAKHLTLFLSRLRRAVECNYDWHQSYKANLVARENRRKLAELISSLPAESESTLSDSAVSVGR